jgi:hypothetical protein
VLLGSDDSVTACLEEDGFPLPVDAADGAVDRPGGLEAGARTGRFSSLSSVEKKKGKVKWAGLFHCVWA